MDIGHTLRSGVDPTEAARAAGPRLLDLHTKDIKMVNGKWVTVDCGEGDINLVAFFRQLKQQGFSGAANLEYEEAGPKRDAAIERCTSYMRGVVAAL